MSPASILLLGLLGGFEASASPTACESVLASANTGITGGQLDRSKAQLTGLLAGFAHTPENTLCLGIAASNLAVIAQREGNLKDAEQYGTIAVATFAQADPDDLAMVRPLQVLAGVYISQGRLEKAKHVIARIESFTMPATKDSALLAGARAAILESEGRVRDAERQYRAAIDEWEKAGEGASLGVVPELCNLALLYMKQKHFDEAALLLRRALKVMDASKEPDSQLRVRVLTNLGILYVRGHDWPGAEAVLGRAMEIARHSGFQSDVKRRLYEAYAAALKQTGHKREARNLESEATAIFGSDPSSAVVSVDSLRRPEKR
jgi:tetratricopeptide (TPR) repeat protein